MERKYGSDVVAVVHLAIPTERKRTSRFRRSSLRAGAPVINDAEFQVWQQYSCRAWPTLMFIDPSGNVIGKHEGELTFEQFDTLLAGMVAEFDELGIMQRSPLPTVAPRMSDSALSFPGKVVADEAGAGCSSPTNHTASSVSSFDGGCTRVIGTARRRSRWFVHRRRSTPQGMAVDETPVRRQPESRIRLRGPPGWPGRDHCRHGEQVTTRRGPSRPLLQPQFPWDVVLHKGVIYIAMAGIHQLWSLDLETGMVGAYAGSGREAITDGPLATSALAQPSGITTDGERLFFADSETSSIRNCDLDPSGSVRTLIGLGLFEFGDVDGDDFRVRMQHPIGITQHDGVLYVADTYNHKIKRVLPRTRSAFSLAGTGSPGHLDGPFAQARFSEPCGLSIANGKMYIADTNNHCVRVADMDAQEVATLELEGL